MQVTTKYNINDPVWAIHPNAKKALPAKVSGINTLQMSKKETKKEGEQFVETGELILATQNIHYQLDFGKDVQAAMMIEAEVFSSKEELITALTS